MGMRHLLALHGVSAPDFISALEEDLTREPEDPARVSIGIGITTHNRPEVLKRTVDAIIAHTPFAKIVVVDDASADPVAVYDATQGHRTFVNLYRFEENVGIARAKNKCLEMLVDAGVEHLFLFDDDAYPIAADWWKPYVESPEPHLMRIFPDLLGPNKLNDLKEVYRDEAHVAYTRPRGIMLYAHRSVLDAVGGMDPGFGKWGYEHGDWSNRIHAAGLTTWRFADVVGAEELIYSLDEHVAVDRTVASHRDRREAVTRNLPRYRAQANSPIRYEFRESRNVILTCLFAAKDPQRPRAAPLTLAALKPLEESVEALGIPGRDLIVFANTTEGQGWAGAQLTEPGMGNVYLARWVHHLRWLRDHPEVDKVWCVDGTDVEVYRDPFDLEPGVIYLGVETVKVGSGWLKRNPHPDVQALDPEAYLLNAGLLGGDRATVIEFLHELVTAYFDNVAEVFESKGKVPDITEHVNDMGLLNVIANRPRWLNRRRYGGDINTVFKANQTREENPYARFRHK